MAELCKPQAVRLRRDQVALIKRAAAGDDRSQQSVIRRLIDAGAQQLYPAELSAGHS